MEWLFTLADIQNVAAEFWKLAGNTGVIVFHGNMGAGKTTFIHALCDKKGVKDIVGSPTFSIINEYSFKEKGLDKKIFHIDLYRLNDEEEARQAGVEDCVYSNHTCLIEWPEKAPYLFPDNTIHVNIEVIDSQTRKVVISGK
ncbi:MAG: tRNA (adenosine(37)-N6)-threonylcarbamoyltransferase complex ATPase subunit type 1 TsaE [Bacteroidetes bacterium]|nr:tRNA (adenosine(37)-N6)-threonylcarbamoyltransferase complex ATPase subunit type 1 TsaE [Bacteroidota bacterium]